MPIGTWYKGSDDLQAHVVSKLQELIVSKGLKPGDKLPSERELSKQLGVSRVTTREALHQFEQWGLVQKKIGVGTFLVDMTRSVLTESLERYFQYNSRTYEELISFREMIEPEIAAQAAKFATKENIESLAKKLEILEEALDQRDVDLYVEYDTGFHEELALIIRNDLIATIVLGLHQLTRGWILKEIQLNGMEFRFEETRKSHRDIFNAIVNNDPEKARDAMKEHMYNTRESHLKIQSTTSDLLNQNLKGSDFRKGN